MLINQIDTKQTDKFCKNFISKIYQCIENFSLIEVVRRLGMGYPLNGTMGDGTQSAPSHCPLVTQDYSQVDLSKLQKLFEVMSSVTITSNLLSYLSFYSKFHSIVIKQS